jgi:prohibitin 2
MFRFPEVNDLKMIFLFFCTQAAQDAKSVVIKAQGEAESAMLIGNALAKNPGFLELRRLETARAVSATMSGSQNKMYLDASSLLLNIADAKFDTNQCVL